MVILSKKVNPPSHSHRAGVFMEAELFEDTLFGCILKGETRKGGCGVALSCRRRWLCF